MSADPERAHVIVVSDRCAAGTATDSTGPHIVRQLRALDYHVESPEVIADGVESVSSAIARALADGATVIITTGGTGIGPRDLTPEGTAEHIATDLPGISEHLRRLGTEHSPHATLSRGRAGLSTNGAFMVNLPGSSQAVAQGVAFLTTVVGHVRHVRAGGDHS